MKVFKRILAVFLVIVLFVGSYIGSYFLFKSGTFDVKAENLSVFNEEESTYYLENAQKDIAFKVDGKPGSYTLTDSSGKKMRQNMQKLSSSSYKILPPDDGYTEGKIYVLTLTGDAKFYSRHLEKAKKVVFVIGREKVEEYTFTDAVVEIKKQIETVSPVEETDGIKTAVINLNGNTAAEGDIIYGRDENGEQIAYKIDELLEDGEAEVSVPALDEIFEDIQLFGTYAWDVKSIATNPELKAEIIENVRNSDFLDSLTIAAYADEKPRPLGLDVEFSVDEENAIINFKVAIKLKPGQKGLFGVKQLKNQEITINLNIAVKVEATGYFDGLGNWSVVANVTTDFAWNVDIAFAKTEKSNKDLDELLNKKIKNETLSKYRKKVKDLTNKLEKAMADTIEGSLPLFDTVIPCGLPFLVIDVEVELFAELELAASLNIGKETRFLTKAGIVVIKYRPTSVYNTSVIKDGDLTVTLKGKLGFKTGFKAKLALAIICDDVANAAIEPAIGVYLDIFATIPITDLKEMNGDKFIYSYFEAGAYFGADFTAYVNLLIFEDIDFKAKIVEKKFPMAELGNKEIALEIYANPDTVRAEGNKAPLPEILFEYFDVSEGANFTKPLSKKDLKFTTVDGTELEVSGKKITRPEATSSQLCYVTASYVHTDDMAYSTTFKILISGSVLEGQVSAYDRNLNKTSIEGAKVTLYSGNGTNKAVSSVETDESGKFSFNVSEGDYTLKITADGYKELISYQTVGEDEIKYTEHMLLMDDQQEGTGSASGKITDALNGKGLSGVNIKLRKEWNSKSGEYVEGVSTTTSSSGVYNLTDIPVGYYTVEASRDGYVTGYANILVLSSESIDDFDFSITPVLSGDEVRIVLTWGSTPRDLDSHLIGLKPSGDSFNVYYRAKKYNYNGVEMANLDVDDTTSYGPETITILEEINGSYIYAVHDYSNRGSNSSDKLSLSGAVVKVFVGSRQVGEYHVPTNQIGTYWTVFEITEDKKVIPVNTISNTKPTM